jgi:hypothetical protein
LSYFGTWIISSKIFSKSGSILGDLVVFSNISGHSVDSTYVFLYWTHSEYILFPIFIEYLLGLCALKHFTTFQTG